MFPYIYGATVNFYLFYSYKKEKNVLLFTRYLRYKIEIKCTETEIHAFIKKDLDCGLLSNESVNVLLRNVAMQYREEKSSRLVRMQQLHHLTLVSLSLFLCLSISKHYTSTHIARVL